jgi:myo-inositol-1(or 4)-monophosphatase
MKPILNIALRAARQACEYINQNVDQNDLALSDANANEKLISHLEATLFQTFFDSLKKANPTHFIIAPDETPSEVKDDSWKVNGFHAPYNLLRKLPATAFSLVHKSSGKVQNALLINPTNGDEYTASRGSGAALNGRRIRCTSPKSLSDATIAINTINQFSSPSESHVIADFVSEVGSNVGQMLVSNCDALDVAMVAAGQIDAAILTKVNAKELDAALLLCQEAGALVGTLNGGVFNDKEDKLIVANPKLFKALVQRFNTFQTRL